MSDYQDDQSALASDTLLLVWDAPNLDMGLGAILGGRPSAAHRPRFDAIGRWLLARAGELSHKQNLHIEAEATTRGNQNWFAVSIATYPLTPYGLPRTNETRATSCRI